ncbi:MAG: acetyltransferase [Limnochordia bacterium]|nr:acetyltransferase [Limnochordia bacterium]
MKKLVIIGAGGFGHEVAWLVERINSIQPTWEIVGYVDDNESLHGSIVAGYPVLGDCAWLREQDRETTYAICAIGASKARKKVIERLGDIRFAVLIDPSVILSERVTVGEGSIISAGTIITVDISIGSHVIINLDCTIGHDAVIEDFVTLYPSVNVSGNTVLGECVEMGTGSQVIQDLRVGDGTIVGAGAVVVKELPRECTAVGCPAKPIKFHESSAVD